MDNQINIDELREATNAEGGIAPTATAEPTPEAAVAEPASGADAESAQKEAPPVAEGQAPTKSDSVSELDKLRAELEYLKETPYQSVADAVKGYKELQSQFSKTTDKIRPYKDIIDRMESDFGLRTFMAQAIQGYDNPQMLQAYEGGSAEPNPANYDLMDPAGQAKFMADVKAYNERTIDQRINQRLMSVEQNAKLEQAKNAFRAKYPGHDPDEVIKFARDKGQNWSLEDIYKVQNYDNIKSEALAEARKEVTKQLETAQKSKTPTTATTASTDIRVEDVLSHITQHGSMSARKKFGDKRVLEILQETA